MLSQFEVQVLQEKFGVDFQSNALIGPYTSARIGGIADGLLIANTLDDLVSMVTHLWDTDIPYIILGGGSNVLVSDSGVRGIVLLNKAREVKFDEKSDPPTVWAASGTNFGQLARQVGQRGLAGLEWASGIPGTVGGAIVGNAGAHGSDVAGQLLMAEILHREIVDKKSKNGNSPSVMIKREQWTIEQFHYSYRSSQIKEKHLAKRENGEDPKSGWSVISQPSVVILGALLRLAYSKRELIESLMEKYGAYRKKTQPGGASMGSMFKNPPGDYAGRLIEEAGLKGIRVGDAAISPLHGNFFVNYGNATATDVLDLINLSKNIVASKFGVDLELEIELVGTW